MFLRWNDKFWSYKFTKLFSLLTWAFQAQMPFLTPTKRGTLWHSQSAVNVDLLPTRLSNVLPQNVSSPENLFIGHIGDVLHAQSINTKKSEGRLNYPVFSPPQTQAHNKMKHIPLLVCVSCFLVALAHVLETQWTGQLDDHVQDSNSLAETFPLYQMVTLHLFVDLQK